MDSNGSEYLHHWLRDRSIRWYEQFADKFTKSRLTKETDHCGIDLGDLWRYLFVLRSVEIHSDSPEDQISTGLVRPRHIWTYRLDIPSHGSIDRGDHHLFHYLTVLCRICVWTVLIKFSLFLRYQSRQQCCVTQRASLDIGYLSFLISPLAYAAALHVITVHNEHLLIDSFLTIDVRITDECDSFSRYHSVLNLYNFLREIWSSRWVCSFDTRDRHSLLPLLMSTTSSRRSTTDVFSSDVSSSPWPALFEEKE